MPNDICDRLLVLASSRQKVSEAGKIPAIQRYDGVLWRVLRVAIDRGAQTNVVFLSPRYGLREADFEIEGYSEELTADVAMRMKERQRSRRAPLADERFHSDALAELLTMRGGRRQPFDDIALCGGVLYVDVMRSFVEYLQEQRSQEHRVIDPRARITTIDDARGNMRLELARWLGVENILFG